MFDSSGKPGGKVRELGLAPQEDRVKVAMLVVKTKEGDRLLPLTSITEINGGIRSSQAIADWSHNHGGEGLFLLERDLLDQQVIDINGRKVVRVNDVDLHLEQVHNRPVLKIGSVDVGARGAVRRLLKGLVPMSALHVLLRQIPPRLIPWDFVDIIETDPARRVKLKISYDRLAKLHPADIADIVEELPRAQREGVFETLDEDVAAGALEELDPRTQVAVLASLNKDRAADIVEEMEPDAAADLLGDLPEAHSGAILQEMEPEGRQQLTTLLEFGEHTAAGRMTTECLTLPADARVGDVAEAIRRFHGDQETLTTVFVIGEDRELVGAVPISRSVIADRTAPLAALSAEPLVSCHLDAPEDEVVELFDKYNLLALPVVDEHGRLAGIITADDVINLLRRDH